MRITIAAIFITTAVFFNLVESSSQSNRVYEDPRQFRSQSSRGFGDSSHLISQSSNQYEDYSAINPQLSSPYGSFGAIIPQPSIPYGSYEALNVQTSGPYESQEEIFPQAYSPYHNYQELSSRSSSRHGNDVASSSRSSSHHGDDEGDPDLTDYSHIAVGHIKGLYVPRDGIEIRSKKGTLVLGKWIAPFTLEYRLDPAPFVILKLKTKNGEYAFWPKKVSTFEWIGHFEAHSKATGRGDILQGAYNRVRQYNMYLQSVAWKKQQEHNNHLQQAPHGLLLNYPGQNINPLVPNNYPQQHTHALTNYQRQNTHRDEQYNSLQQNMQSHGNDWQQYFAPGTGNEYKAMSARFGIKPEKPLQNNRRNVEEVEGMINHMGKLEIDTQPATRSRKSSNQPQSARARFFTTKLLNRKNSQFRTE